MDISNIYDKLRLAEENLLDYGFIKTKDGYLLSRDILNSTMYAEFFISSTKITVDVYDYFDNEIYLPFNILNAKGKFVSTVKDEVAVHLEDILSKCFILEDIKEKLNNYVKDKYQTEPVYPWDDENYVYKVNDKWFGLVMNVKYQSLGISREGKVDVINIKLDPELIDQLVDNHFFFRAYHMNKKYWMTILLSTRIDFDLITKYLDESYHLVKNS